MYAQIIGKQQPGLAKLSSHVLNLAFIAVFFILIAWGNRCEAMEEHHTIYSSVHDPYTKLGGVGSLDIDGVVGEVLNGAFRHAKIDGMFQIEWLPWKRAQEMAQEDERGFILPLTRVDERESLYRWVISLRTSSICAFTVNAGLDISTVQSISSLRVGSLAGSPATFEALRVAPELIGKVEPEAFEATNLRKLMMGRIDVWITQEEIARSMAVRKGLGDHLVRGFKFFDQDLWLAANKNINPHDALEARAAIAEFMQTSDYQILMRKFDY